MMEDKYALEVLEFPLSMRLNSVCISYDFRDGKYWIHRKSDDILKNGEDRGLALPQELSSAIALWLDA
jgi:hypothetical protein